MIDKILFKNMVFLVTGIFLICCIVLANPATTIYIEPASQNVINGSSFKINISINTDENAYGAQFDLYFNSSILQAVSVVEGNFFKQGANTFFSGGIIDNNVGKIDNVYVSRYGTQTGVSGTGSIAEITFNTKNTGTSYLNLGEVKAAKIPSGGGIPTNITDLVVQNGLVNVNLPEFISITLLGYDSGIQFGNLNPGTNINPALNNGNYVIKINPETNVNVDIYHKGTGFSVGENAMNINNMRWYNSNDAGSAYVMQNNYGTNKISNNAPNSNINMYYWLSIPQGQPAAENYESQITIKAVKTGSSPEG